MPSFGIIHKKNLNISAMYFLLSILTCDIIKKIYRKYTSHTYEILVTLISKTDLLLKSTKSQFVGL